MSHKLISQVVTSAGFRLSIEKAGKEVARAYVYLMNNDLHKRPFALLEDVYVEESERGSGIGTQIVEEAIKTAKAADAYKLLATSRTARERVHKLYERLGFERHGFEFRMNF